MAQKQALGKGLASLFPGILTNPAVAAGAVDASLAIPAPPRPGNLAGNPAGALLDSGNRDRHPGISLAHVDEIQTNPYQPRRDFDEASLLELSASIEANGIIQPLVVRKGPTGGYQLIAGERRLRAAKRAGLKQVPVVIRRSTDREALELALIENIQREDLNCVDEALAYLQLMEEFNLTQEEVAKRTGKDRTTVANTLRILRLPQAVIDDLRKKALSFGHGKALLGLEESDDRLMARAQVIEKHLSVRETEALVESMKQSKLAAAPGPRSEVAGQALASTSRFSSLSLELTRKLSTRVELKGSERKGRIEIHFGSRPELDRILEAIQTLSV